MTETTQETGWIEEIKDTHICIICSKKFQQKLPMLQFPVGVKGREYIDASSQLLDEFGIFLGLQHLGLSESVAEDLFRELFDAVGEPGAWGVSFCCEHEKILKKALEMDQLIKRHNILLENIQLELIEAVKTELKKETETDQPEESKAFEMIQNSLKSVHLEMSPPTKGKKAISRKTKKTNKAEKPSKVVETIILESNDESFNIDPHNLSYEDISDEDWQDVPLSIVLEDLKHPSENHEEEIDSSLRKRKSSTPVGESLPGPKRLLKSSNNGNGRFYACEFCATTFHTSKEREDHIKQTHGAKPYLCDCGKSYASSYSLKYHIDRCHQPGDQFPCEKCPMVLLSQRDLTVHIRQKHSAQAKNENFKASTSSNHVPIMKPPSKIRNSSPPILKTIPVNPTANIQSKIQQLLKDKEYHQSCFKCGEDVVNINHHKRFCNHAAF